jgi:isocitrate dehydrogenase
MQTLVKKHEHGQEIVKDLEELMPGATLVTCSGFGDAIVDCM